MKKFFRDAAWWTKRAPITAAIVGLVLLVGIISQSLWVPADESGMAAAYGWGVPAFAQGKWWTIGTGLFITPVPWMALLILPLIIFGGGYLEYRFGALRMLAAFFVTHIAAVLIVIGTLNALAPLGIGWAVELSKVQDVGFSNAGLGAIGAATAALSLSWRRRLRSGLFLYALAFVLFSGVLWDLTHFVALLVGFAVGPAIVKRRYEKPSFSLTTQDQRNLVAQVLVFDIIMLVVVLLAPGKGGILELNNTGGPDASIAIALLVIVIFLALMAYGMYAGRRFAWRVMLAITLLILLVLLLLNAILGFDTAAGPFVIGVNLLLLVLLIAFRRSFRVVGDKFIRRKVYRNLALIALGVVALSTLTIFVFRDNFDPQPDLGMAAAEAILAIFGFSGGNFVPTTDLGGFLTGAIGSVWIAAIIVGIGVLVFNTLRDREGRGQFDSYDRLLHETGTTSIGWMTRWTGMSFWLNSYQTAGFAYRLENNIALVLSDPIGKTEAVAESFTAFTDMCDRHGWRPTFYSVSEPFRGLAAGHGFKSIVVGEDTVIDLPNLAFTGKSWQSVRSAINTAGKLGITMQSVHYNEAAPELRAQLQAIADSWAGDKALPALGFTLGTLKEAEDPEVVMHLAVDAEGSVHGMTSWMPVYRDGKITGWTLDIMQRRLSDDTMKGVVEYLIAETAMTFKAAGYEFISLSASPLSHSEAETGPVEAVLDLVAKRIEPFYGFASLHAFKAKFKPRFEPMYLCFADDTQLPAISVAIMKAYMPDRAIRTVISSKLGGSQT